MAPSEFRQKAHYNWEGASALLSLEWHRFWTQKWTLLANLLTPLLYFFFIITALAPMMGRLVMTDYSVGYAEYALVGLMAMNLISQMGKTMYQISNERKYGLFAMHMQSGIRPLLYLIVKGMAAVWGFLFQSLCFLVLIFLFQIHISLYQFGLLCLMGLASLYFWIGFGAIMSLFTGNGMTRNLVLSFFMMLLTFSAPSFYTYQDAPQLVQSLSRINPMTYQLHAMREAAFSSISWSAVGYLCFFSLLSMMMAIFITNRIPLVEKEK